MAIDTRPAVCYTCGNDIEDGPRFGAEATCDACRRAGPVAVFAFEQPDFKGGTLLMYHILGGDLDRSTVTAATVAAMGIPVVTR